MKLYLFCNRITGAMLKRNSPKVDKMKLLRLLAATLSLFAGQLFAQSEKEKAEEIIAGEGVLVEQRGMSARLVAPLSPAELEVLLIGNTAEIRTPEGEREYEYHRPNHLTFYLTPYSEGRVVEGIWYFNGSLMCWYYSQSHCKQMWSTDSPDVIAEVFPGSNVVRQLWRVTAGDSMNLRALSNAVAI